jgi:hypothetical protein
MVAQVRGREGGRFRVTPEYGLVLVWQPAAENPKFFVAGRLNEPFKVVEEADAADYTADVAGLRAGDDYVGPSDKKGGTFKVTQRSGGLIERRVPGGAETALANGTGHPGREMNAHAILEAWDELERSFSRFFVNSLGHAWYEGPSGRKFLANVQAGFAWPSVEDE